mmetsp:Transcript_89581/g.240236  ORF Transcript_89581/g.240236 Transcript_89581/m.240236 type:complete len:463 (+) Transcript_89581:2667-4055(+)
MHRLLEIPADLRVDVVDEGLVVVLLVHLHDLLPLPVVRIRHDPDQLLLIRARPVHRTMQGLGPGVDRVGRLHQQNLLVVEGSLALNVSQQGRSLPLLVRMVDLRPELIRYGAHQRREGVLVRAQPVHGILERLAPELHGVRQQLLHGQLPVVAEDVAVLLAGLLHYSLLQIQPGQPLVLLADLRNLLAGDGGKHLNQAILLVEAVPAPLRNVPQRLRVLQLLLREVLPPVRPSGEGVQDSPAHLLGVHLDHDAVKVGLCVDLLHQEPHLRLPHHRIPIQVKALELHLPRQLRRLGLQHPLLPHHQLLLLPLLPSPRLQGPGLAPGVHLDEVAQPALQEENVVMLQLRWSAPLVDVEELALVLLPSGALGFELEIPKIILSGEVVPRCVVTQQHTHPIQNRSPRVFPLELHQENTVVIEGIPRRRDGIPVGTEIVPASHVLEVEVVLGEKRLRHGGGVEANEG